MTENTEPTWYDNEDDGTDSHPAGRVNLAPVVTFGLRAAALAGVVATVGAVAAGVIGIGAGSDDTTCCPRMWS